MSATSHNDQEMDRALGSNDVRYDLKPRPVCLLRGRNWNERNDFGIGKAGYGFVLAPRDGN